MVEGYLSTSSFQHFHFRRASVHLALLTLILRIAAHVEPVHHRHTISDEISLGASA